MRRVTIISLMLLVSAGSQARADQSIRLRVSATIPPRPCEYPNPCSQSSSRLKNVVTRATVSNQSVHYVGTPPEVTVKDGVKTIIF